MSKLNTPKYRAVKASIDPLANACKDELTRVATLLFGRSLITGSALEKARNATQPTYDRSSDLMTSVLRKIEEDEANYDVFISELSKMSELDIVVKRLEEARKEYEHSSVQQQFPSTNPNPNTGQGPGHSGAPGNLRGPTTGARPSNSYPLQGAAGYGPSAPNGRAVANDNTPHGGTDYTAQPNQVSPTAPDSSRSPPELPTTRTVVKRDHYGILCEKLQDCAPNDGWKRVAAGLRFSAPEIAGIASNLTHANGGPGSYMNAMIGVWMDWGPGDARGSKDVATLEALKAALRTANFGNVALSLTLEDS